METWSRVAEGAAAPRKQGNIKTEKKRKQESKKERKKERKKELILITFAKLTRKDK